MDSWRCCYDCKLLYTLCSSHSNLISSPIYTGQVTYKIRYYYVSLTLSISYVIFPLSLFLHTLYYYTSKGIDRLWWPEWCVFRECGIQHRLGTSGQNTRQLTIPVCLFRYTFLYSYSTCSSSRFTCNCACSVWLLLILCTYEPLPL